MVDNKILEVEVFNPETRAWVDGHIVDVLD
jgi:hypothetical protein